MKNSFYFDHDYSARNDQKILELRAEYGWQGYGIYFAILEILCESKGYIKREAFAGLSLGLNKDKSELITLIEFCLKITLFLENEKGIYSQRILDHLAFREKLSEAGSKGGRGNKATQKPPFREDKAPPEAVKESKGEDSKEEKEYIKESFLIQEFCKPHFEERYINEKSLDCFKKLIKLDKYTSNQIKEAILNARSEPFWDANFLSPCKLRSNDKNGVKYIDRFLKLKKSSIKTEPAKSIVLNYLIDGLKPEYRKQ
jgi:hypothetical protein